MYTYNDIANFVIQNLSAATINVASVKDELRQSIIDNNFKASDDAKTTIYLLRKAVLLSSIFMKRSSWVTLYDMDIASRSTVIQLDTVSVPALQFKLPDAPVCYVNRGIVNFLTEVLTIDPKADYRLSFKPNFSNDAYYTIIRMRKNNQFLSAALKLHLKARFYKNLLLVYI